MGKGKKAGNSQVTRFYYRSSVSLFWGYARRILERSYQLSGAEGHLRHEAEQLQGVDIQPDHTGARLQGHLVPECAADRGREL